MREKRNVDYAVVEQMGKLMIFRWNEGRETVEVLTLGEDLALVEWIYYPRTGYIKIGLMKWSIEGVYVGEFKDLLDMHDEKVLLRVIAHIDNAKITGGKVENRKWLACEGYCEGAEKILEHYNRLPFLVNLSDKSKAQGA